jgi:hypothetical protein
MIYAGDELYGDEITSGEVEDDWLEPYCDYCEMYAGHTFRNCPARDDAYDASDDETWGEFDHYGS